MSFEATAWFRNLLRNLRAGGMIDDKIKMPYSVVLSACKTNQNVLMLNHNFILRSNNVLETLLSFLYYKDSLNPSCHYTDSKRHCILKGNRCLSYLISRSTVPFDSFCRPWSPVTVWGTYTIQILFNHDCCILQLCDNTDMYLEKVYIEMDRWYIIIL